MAMYTRVDSTMGRLAYQHQDRRVSLVYNQIAPGIEMPMTAGLYKELDERAYFLERDFQAGEKTRPEAFTVGDSSHRYTITPIAGSFEFTNVQLSRPGLYGKKNAAEMIREQQQVLGVQMRKSKEKALYTLVSDNTQFEGATYYANASTAWSSTGTANMKDDVDAGKLILGGGPYRLTMSNTASIYAFANATLNASTVVSAPRRDGSVNPNPTAAFLENYFGVDELYIAQGDLITDSGDPTDTTKAEIWGDKVLLEQIGSESLMQGSWCKQLFFRPLGRGEPGEGWFTIETGDDAAGGVGTRKFDTWNYYCFEIQEKSMAYRIDAVY